MNAFEIKGFWWFPEKSGRKYAGTLNYSPKEGAELQISEIIESNKDFPGLLRIPVLFGIDTLGRRITVFDLFNKESVSGFSGITLKTYQVILIIIGDYLLDFDTVPLDMLSFRVTYLEQWLQITGFETSIQWLKSGDSNILQEASIKYKQTLPINVNISDELSLEIKHSANMPYGLFHEYTLSEKATVIIRAGMATYFKNLISYANRFADLISLVTNKIVHICYIGAYSPKSVTQYSDGNIIKNHLEIYFELPYTFEREKYLHDSNVIIKYKEIRHEFRDILKIWFQQYERFGPTLRLYFFTFNNPRENLENKFLNLCNTLESFHRIKYEGKYESDECFHNGLYKIFKTVIPDTISKDYHESIINKLYYLNEYSLRKRLKYLLNEFKGCLIYTHVSEKIFVNHVVDTRNYMVHMDKKLKNKSLQGEDLFLYIKDLDRLVRACFITLLNFNSKQAIKMLGS